MVGPTPPPIHGVSQIIGWLVGSPVFADGLRVLHLDTSDRRSSANLGRIDAQNVVLGLKSVADLVALCAVRRPDILYYTLSQATNPLLRDAVLACIARAFGVIRVVQLAGSGYFRIVERASLAGRLIRWAMDDATLVLVLGEAQVAAAERLTRHGRVAVAPNGLPVPDGHAARVPEHPGCRLLYLGSLKAAKGVVASLEALALVRERRCDVSATFAGSWANDAERAGILTVVERLGLTAAVDFPGVVEGEAKDRLLEAADVYVLASLGEGQPVSILEAMAHGLPVIATRVGAVPDTVVDGSTGFLVEPGDVTGVADAVIRLAADPGLRVAMGQAGRERYLALFTLERSHDILREHLLRVIAGRRTGTGRTKRNRTTRKVV